MHDHLVPINAVLDKNYDINSYSRLKDTLIYNERVHMVNMFECDDKLETLKKEIVFCIMTPQSKAKSAQAALKKCDFRLELLTPEVLRECAVRFPNVKADNIKRFINADYYDELRQVLDKTLIDRDFTQFRNFLNKNVRGIGLKEASHVCRNIGFSDIGIIDRHILKCMCERKLVSNIAKITKANYTKIERIFLDYAKETNIPPNHLDMMWWASKSKLFLK